MTGVQRNERIQRHFTLGIAAVLVILVGVDPSVVSPLVPWLAAGAEPLATDETRSGNLATAFARIDKPIAVDTVPIDGEWAPLPEPVMETGPVDLPSADTEVVPLSGGAAARTAGEPEPVVVDLGGMETTVAATSDGGSPAEVLLRVSDQASTEAAGIDGLLLDVIDPSVTAGEPVSGSSVDLKLSYADFGDVGGGDWASRLRFVRIPGCPEELIEEPECAPVPITTVNDPVEQTISAVIPVTAATAEEPPVGEPPALEPTPAPTEEPTPSSEPTPAPTEEPEPTPTDAPSETPAPAPSPTEEPATGDPHATGEASEVAALGPLAAVTTLTAGAVSDRYAVTTAVSGPAGDWSATGLSATSSWATSGATGGFTWAYPMRVPPVAAGPVPEISLAYSSATSDGRVPSENNQSGWVGEGFDVPGGFIERSYKPCMKDAPTSAANNYRHQSGDLCWGTDNATLVFKGSAVELIKGAGNEWVPKRDDGTRVERLTGAWNEGVAKEYWKVTTVDGTQYFFGRGARPGNSTELNSAWTVPVYGNHPGEPGYEATFATSDDLTVWRWNLDYVVDASGNSMTYFYDVETNLYVPNYWAAKRSDRASYVAGGHLNRIEYGTRAGQETDVAPAKVVFTSAPRCLLNKAVADELCSSGDDAKTWPDAPKDLVCKPGASCLLASPVFFDRSRLVRVATFANDGSGAGYRPMDSWNLRQSFVGQGDGASIEYAMGRMLRLEGVQHTAHNGTSAIATDDIKLPENTFGYEGLRNRVQRAEVDKYPAMQRHRLETVRTESGAQITVSYRTECGIGDVPADPANNTKLCFPVKWQPEGEDSHTDYFHKYVVSSIVEDGVPADTTDSTRLITGSEAISTVYTYDTTYPGARATLWAKPTGAAVDAAEATYSEFRGYPKVTTTLGTGETTSKTEAVYYRGFSDTLKAGPAEIVSGTDADRYTGETFTTVVMNGSKKVSETITTHAAPKAVPGAQGATRVPSTTVDSFVYNAAGAKAMRTRTVTTLNDDSQPITVDDKGDFDATADDLCTTTTYTTAFAASHQVALPSKVEQLAVEGCQPPADWAEAIVASTLYGYDAAGRPNGVQELTPEAPTSGPQHQTRSTVKYDERGRATTVTDAAGQVTTTTYVPTTSGLTKQIITTPPDPDGTAGPVEAFVTTTNLDPFTGTVTSSTDVNGKTTSATYDALARRTAVRYPQHATGTPSVEYEYKLETNGLNAVTTKTIGADGKRQHLSVALYDGLLRQFQTQVEAADAGETHLDDAATRGRMVAQTYYDSAGRIQRQTGQWFATEVPQAVAVKAEKVPPATTTYRYDGAGRTTDEIFWLGAYGEPANEQWRTVTIYDGLKTLTVPPQGATPTETLVDGRGRTVKLIEYARDAESNVTSADVLADPTRLITEIRALTTTTTTYKYDSASRLIEMTDEETNTWKYDYDRLGRQESADDPDSGVTETRYDLLDRVTSVKNATGQTLEYTYDPLGRKTSMRDPARPAGEGATWVYDHSVDEDGKPIYGTVTAATRTTAAGTFTTTTPQYDDAYRPRIVETTLPEVAPYTSLEQTSFTTEYSYTGDGQNASVTLPAVMKAGATSPVLGREIVTTHYDSTSRPWWTGGGFGWGTYVAESRYGAQGHLLMADLGNTYGAGVTYHYQTGTNRLEEMALDRERVGGMDVKLAYEYDDAGNVTKILDQPTDAKVDNQCFNYDGHRRLSLAWTPQDGNCERTAAQITPSMIGGAAPYWTEYTYDPIGNRETKTAHATDGTAGTVTTTYTNGEGAAGPHQVTGTAVSINGGSATATSYTYDAAGRTTARAPQGGTVTQLTWNAETELSQVTSGTASSSFVYTADGDRMVRTDASGTTVYLPGGQEIQITSTSVKATRYYSFAGQIVAVRTGKGLGGVTSLMNDAHGTPVAAVPNKEQPDLNPVDRFYTDPFGGVRGSSSASTVPGDQQFLGKTRDASTGYTLLGARYYDETLGRFLTVDPILDLTDPQQWNGYAYAGNNPTTFEDASGLLMLGADDFSGYNTRTGQSTTQGQGSSANSIISSHGAASQSGSSRAVTVSPPVQASWQPLWYLNTSTVASRLMLELLSMNDQRFAVVNKDSGGAGGGGGGGMRIPLSFGYPSRATADTGARSEGMGLGAGRAAGAIQETGGPGRWGIAWESMSRRAAAYQSQVTGQSAGSVYKVNGVKFDGYSNGVLQEAKGPGYARFVKEGQFRNWFSGADDLAQQAQRQLNAAGGARITWSVAEAEASTAITNLFRSRGITGINVVHVPAN